MQPKDVVILGAGIIGCLVAHHLTRAGANVLVVDRKTPGCEASGSNAGTLAVQNKEVRLVSFAQAAVDEWQRLDEEFGNTLGYRRSGGIRVAVTDEQAKTLDRIAREQRAQGIEVETLTGQDIFDHAPYLSRSTTLVNYCPTDGMGDPLKATRVIAEKIRGSGVTIEDYTTVTSISPAGSVWHVNTDRGSVTAEVVVVAFGAWLAPFLERMGIHVPISLRINQLMVSERLEPFVPGVVTNLAETLTLKQVDPGTFVIGGGWQGTGDLDKHAPWPSHESFRGNALAAIDLIPVLREASIVRTWARFDTRTPDKLPLCGTAGGYSNLFVIGTGHAGFTFGPLVSKLAVSLILGDLKENELAAWKPERIAMPVAHHAS